jgi:neopullulanase
MRYFIKSFQIDSAKAAKIPKWQPLHDGVRLPTAHNFMGGDLHGITAQIPYLQELGVTAIYLTPVFVSASNHRYHTDDYFHVDPLLGGDEALRRLLDAAHAVGIKVILDGVFNHCGRGFFPFHHVVENGVDSPYREWFYIESLPLYPYDESKPAGYAAWWNLRALPKLNVN